MYPNTLQYECSLIVYLYLSNTEDWDIVISIVWASQQYQAGMTFRFWIAPGGVWICVDNGTTLNPPCHGDVSTGIQMLTWNHGIFLRRQCGKFQICCVRNWIFFTISWSISSNQNRYFNMIFPYPNQVFFVLKPNETMSEALWQY